MMGEAFALWLEPEFLQGLRLGDGPDMQALVRDAVDVANANDPLDGCLAFDVAAYLPSHNLFFTDKATMAASVEVRVALSQQLPAEYVMDLPHARSCAAAPPSWCSGGRRGGTCPPGVGQAQQDRIRYPIRSWLRGSLRPMVIDLLSPARVRRRGLFGQEGVARCWGCSTATRWIWRIRSGRCCRSSSRSGVCEPERQRR